MDWGKYLKYAAIGVAGYYVLAKAGVFGESNKQSPFGALAWQMGDAFAPLYSSIAGNNKYAGVKNLSAKN